MKLACYRSLQHGHGSMAALLLYLVLVTTTAPLPSSAQAAWNATTVANTDTTMHLRGAPLSLREQVSTNDRRYLMEGHNDFKLLECNQPACRAGTSTWTAEGYNPAAGLVVIPCGKCITMDYPGPLLELPFGLDVRGSLFFPDAYKLQIETPFVLVQGNLHMSATNAVTGEPLIRILLTGTDDSLTEFVPDSNNRYACSEGSSGTPEPCREGAKSFIVAGGRLEISGLPDRCKTWVLLEALVASSDDVIPEDYTRGFPNLDPNHPNPRCRSYNTPYIDDSFKGRQEQSWTGGFFGMWDRESKDEYGPTFDLLNVRDCLVPNQVYLFSCRVRFNSGTHSGFTPCARNGSNCMQLKSYVRLENGQIGRRKGAETQTDGFRYGRWEDFYATFSFDRAELDADAVYQILRLEGLEPDVVIDLDDVKFYLPPPDLVPAKTEVCGGNLIRNGDASASEIHPFPLESWGGKLSVQTAGNGNSYFRIESRSSSTDSIAYHLPATACMVAGGRYRVSARVRVKSKVAVKPIIVFRAFSSGELAARFVMAECPASSRQFVNCDSEFVVPLGFDADMIDELRLSFETPASRAVFEVDDWQLELVAGSKESLLVQENGVAGCWDKGAEILITSHTTDLESAQVRRLVSTPRSRGDGFVRLDLDEAIAPPVMVQDGDGFAVEVALLSRNIRFEGATDDPDSLLGGHLIVLHTPDVQQKLQGVEIRNFGRQGQLGRYPIHFHLCNSVEGAIVSKNSIIDSNQRCIVVHGTHNLTVADNVAFETKGHCYMTEDGGEFDNVFKENLGASTRSARRLVRSFETDRINPSTFWAPNPANTWIGNVAAGSESMGFWFELQDAVRPPTSFMPLSRGVVPRRIPLKLFVDNIAHSNRRSGLRTYPFGYLPPQEVTFDNTRSYKNRQDGVFLHNTINVQLRGGVLADNGVYQADLDRADDITVNGVQVIGLTKRYQEIISTQAEAPALPDVLIGLELHSFSTDMSRQGATIRNVRFSGFPISLGKDMALIQVDDDKWTGTFDYWSTIEGVQIDSDSSPFQFNFMKAAGQGISNVYLTDLDSGMKPSSSTASGTSTVVSDSNEMKAFIDMDRCDSFPEQGYLYCENTCLRTITYATSPAETEDYYLFVADSTGRSFLFPGRFHYETGDGVNADLRKRRYFTPALPAGEYVVEFRSRWNGPVWPAFVETTFESSLCSGSVRVGNVQLNVPSVSRQTCAELITNGDMEMSTDSHLHWLQRDNGIFLAPGRGINRSNAIVDMSQASSRGSIGQFLDTRCLTLGEQFDVRVWMQLERNGSPYPCDGNNCPTVGLRVRQPMDAEGTSFSEYLIPVATSFVRPFEVNGWNLMQSTFVVDQRLVAASSVALSVDRGLSKIRMYLDNIFVSRIDRDCSNLVFNGDFSDDKSVFWEKEGSTKSVLELIEIEGNAALALTKRSSNSDTMIQQIRVGCMTRNKRFVASARFRLVLNNGEEFHCNPSSRDKSVSCPRMRLRSFVNVGQPDQDIRVHPGGAVAVADHGMTTGGWHTISGIFSATRFDELAEKIVLSFVDAPVGKDLILDEVSISLSPLTCMQQLLMNGNAEEDETARFWQSIGGGSKTAIDVVRLGGSQVFKISDRTNTGDGMQQPIDPNCFENQQHWKFTARMKLVSKSSGKGVSCDPNSTRVISACPPILITGFVGKEKMEEMYRMTNKQTWVADAFNDYEVEFFTPTTLSGANVLSIAIRTYNLDWDLYVDDMSLSPW